MVSCCEESRAGLNKAALAHSTPRGTSLHPHTTICHAVKVMQMNGDGS